MNYQIILKLPWVINLVLSLVNEQPMMHPSNKIKITMHDEKYYIKDSEENLFLIQEDMRNYYRVKQVLDTCILFEENKEYPINCFTKIQNAVRSKYDYELLKVLQIQYSINKLYFSEVISI